MKVLGIFFMLCGAVLGVLAAVDDYLETDAQLATPPVAYVSPSYIPPHSDNLWIIAVALGALCIHLARKKSQS